jgi:hypothetical protein
MPFTKYTEDMCEVKGEYGEKYKVPADSSFEDDGYNYTYYDSNHGIYISVWWSSFYNIDNVYNIKDITRDCWEIEKEDDHISGLLSISTNNTASGEEKKYAVSIFVMSDDKNKREAMFYQLIDNIDLSSTYFENL